MNDNRPNSPEDSASGQGEPIELVGPGSEGSDVFEGSRGMYLDPLQIPMALMEPATEAGQPVAPSEPTSQASAPEGQPEAE